MIFCNLRQRWIIICGFKVQVFLNWWPIKIHFQVKIAEKVPRNCTKFSRNTHSLFRNTILFRNNPFILDSRNHRNRIKAEHKNKIGTAASGHVVGWYTLWELHSAVQMLSCCKILLIHNVARTDRSWVKSQVLIHFSLRFCWLSFFDYCCCCVNIIKIRIADHNIHSTDADCVSMSCDNLLYLLLCHFHVSNSLLFTWHVYMASYHLE